MRILKTFSFQSGRRFKMGKINWRSQQSIDEKVLEWEQKKQKEEKLEKQIESISTALQGMIRLDELSPEEIESLIFLYPPYKINHPYEAGQTFEYEGKLYQVISEHTSLSNWIPSELPALYRPVVPENTIGDWARPTGAHDAYNVGDKVLFNGKIYESLINANTWSPTEYPQGWKLID